MQRIDKLDFAGDATPMPGTEYRVRIPPDARPAFGGRSRLRRRFVDPRQGAAWVASIHAALARHRAGGDIALAGLSGAKDGTLRTAAARWLAASQVADSTRGWYRIILGTHIAPYLGTRRVPDITRPVVLEWLSRLAEDDRSEDTRKKALGVCKSVLRHARDHGQRIDPAALAVRPPRPAPRRQRRYDPGLIDRILDSLEAADHAVVLTATQTGMRKGEIKAMRVEWIRWRQGVIEIPDTRAYRTKSRRSRTVPLSRALRAVLRAHLKRRRSGLVFLPDARTPTATGIDLRALVQRIRDAGHDIGGMHDFRHHYLSHLAARGVDIRTLQEVAGHQDIQTTQRYMQHAPDYLSRARAALDEA